MPEDTFGMAQSIRCNEQGPVVQSVVSLTSSLRVILLTVIADSIYNILIFFLHCKSYSHFFSKRFQHICVSLNVNFNESLTNDVVSFEQLGPVVYLEKILTNNNWTCLYYRQSSVSLSQVYTTALG